jgi:hypothetical protein
MALGLTIAIGDLLIANRQPHATTGDAVLRHAAALVSERSGLQPAPGQYLFTETRSFYQATIYQQDIESGSFVPVADAQYFETEDSWADINGFGTVQFTRSPLAFPSSSDQAAWNDTAAGRAFSGQFRESLPDLPLMQLVPNLSGLSTDPNELAHQIAAGSDGTNVDLIPDGPSAVFQRAARLLVGPDSGMTPSLASSLYRVLANQPHVSLNGATTDHSGRRGIEVSVSDRENVSALVLDPASGMPLEVQYSPRAGPTSSASGGMALQCTPMPECGSPPETLTPTGTVISLSPIWTDTVTSRIVNALGTTGSP